MKKKIIIKEPHAELQKRSSSGFGNSVWTEDKFATIHKIEINKIIPYKKQARKDFDETELANFAESIKKYGIRQPLTVIQNKEGLYEVISGERRLKAAIIAELQRVPCIILEQIEDAEEIALVENLHRKDLSLLELGEAFANYINDRKCSSIELAEKLNIPQTKIYECMKFASLNDNIKQELERNDQVSRKILREITKIKSDKEKLEYIEKAAKKDNKEENKKNKVEIKITILEKSIEITANDKQIEKLKTSDIKKIQEKLNKFFIASKK